MKRIIPLILILTILLSVTAFAETLALYSVYIDVALDSGEVVVNEEVIDCPSPFISDSGVAMISLSVITDAFDANVEMNASSIVITFLDVEMKYSAGSSTAVINGQSLTMPESTMLVDGTIFVPLRFVSETFGADVMYDSEANCITVRGSEFEGGGSVDFRMLFKYGDAKRVGDSKTGWSFDKPQDFDMYRSYYSGDYWFYIEDLELDLTVERNRDNITLDRLYIRAQSEARGYYSYYMPPVMFEKSKGTRAGLPYVCVKYRTSDYILEMHGFITDKYLYLFSAQIPYENFATDRDNDTLNDIFNSFRTNYNGDDDETVDVSEQLSASADTELKEIYQDGNLGWEIKPSAGWTVDEYYGYNNHVYLLKQSELNDEIDEEFFDYYYDDYGYYEEDYVEDAVLAVSVFSNPDKQTVDAWISEQVASCCDVYNEKYMSVSAVTDTTVNNMPAKKITIDVDFIDYTRRSEMFFIYDTVYNTTYRYMLTLDYDTRDLESENFLKDAHSMISTFIIADLKFEDIGDILQPDGNEVTDKITKEHDGEYMSFTLPYLWYVNEYSGNIYISSDYRYYYYSDGDSLSIMRGILDDIDDDGEVYYKTLEEIINDLVLAVRKNDIRNIVILKPVEKTEFKGREAYICSIGTSSSDKDMLVREVEILLVAGSDNDYFVITKQNSELYRTVRTERIIGEIIDSIEMK